MTRKAWTSKERHASNLLEYLSNPENEFLSRREYAKKVLGYKRPHSIYGTFSPDELYDIEQQALDKRRKKYASQLAKIDGALFQRALDGDPQAIKLCYQRFEGWSEKKLLDANITHKEPLVIENGNAEDKTD